MCLQPLFDLKSTSQWVIWRKKAVNKHSQQQVGQRQRIALYAHSADYAIAKAV